ncbi:hypothetical protein [Streptomyces sp. A5-4]
MLRAISIKEAVSAFEVYLEHAVDETLGGIGLGLRRKEKRVVSLAVV